MRTEWWDKVDNYFHGNTTLSSTYNSDDTLIASDNNDTIYYPGIFGIEGSDRLRGFEIDGGDGDDSLRGYMF